MNFLKFLLLSTVGLFLSTTTFVVPKHVETKTNFSGADDDEVVEKLPLVDFPLKYRHFSGFLKSIENIKLHYWFFESQNKPETDPVVLWLTGGPG